MTHRGPLHPLTFCDSVPEFYLSLLDSLVVESVFEWESGNLGWCNIVISTLLW